MVVIFIMLVLCTLGCAMQLVQAAHFRNCKGFIAWAYTGAVSAFFMVLFGLKAFVWPM